MELSPIGKIAEKFWLEISKHFPSVNLDEFQTMPNHIHGMIEIDKSDDISTVGTGYCPVPTGNQGGSKFGHVNPKSISTIIGSFKLIVTKSVNQKYPKNNFTWQPRFHDRIIRNEKELQEIRKYICENQAKWHFDKYNFDK